MVDHPADDDGEGVGHYGNRRSQRKLPDVPAHILNHWAREYANGRLTYAEESELQENLGSDDSPATEETEGQLFASFVGELLFECHPVRS